MHSMDKLEPKVAGCRLQGRKDAHGVGLRVHAIRAWYLGNHKGISVGELRRISYPPTAGNGLIVEQTICQYLRVRRCLMNHSIIQPATCNLQLATGSEVGVQLSVVRIPAPFCRSANRRNLNVQMDSNTCRAG